jgi:hypothetical protein
MEDDGGGCAPELQLGMRRHVSRRELPRASLDIFRLRWVPCWSVSGGHGGGRRSSLAGRRRTRSAIESHAQPQHFTRFLQFVRFLYHANVDPSRSCSQSCLCKKSILRRRYVAPDISHDLMHSICTSILVRRVSARPEHATAQPNCNTVVTIQDYLKFYSISCTSLARLRSARTMNNR